MSEEKNSLMIEVASQLAQLIECGYVGVFQGDDACVVINFGMAVAGVTQSDGACGVMMAGKEQPFTAEQIRDAYTKMMHEAEEVNEE